MQLASKGMTASRSGYWPHVTPGAAKLPTGGRNRIGLRTQSCKFLKTRWDHAQPYGDRKGFELSRLAHLAAADIVRRAFQSTDLGGPRGKASSIVANSMALFRSVLNKVSLVSGRHATKKDFSISGFWVAGAREGYYVGLIWRPRVDSFRTAVIAFAV